MLRQQTEQLEPGRRGRSWSSCCPCSTPRPGRDPARGRRRARPPRARRSCRSRRCSPTSSSQGGLERIDDTGVPFDPTHPRGGRALERGADDGRPGRGRRVVEVLRAGYRLEGPGAAPGDGQGGTATAEHGSPSASGSRRTTTRSWACPPTATDKEITQRLPQARQAVPPRRQPGLRGPLQGDLGRLRRARRRRRSARSTTRSAPGPRAGPGSFGGTGVGPARERQFRLPRSTDLGDLLGDLFGGGARGGTRRRGAARTPGRRGAPTSRPSCTCPSRTPCRV